jgi:hypothetical protein
MRSGSNPSFRSCLNLSKLMPVAVIASRIGEKVLGHGVCLARVIGSPVCFGFGWKGVGKG